MPRPQKERIILEPPKIRGMKPLGIPGQVLDVVCLSLDEYEAIRLADHEKLDHQEASDLMGVSRPTFSRLIEKARSKVAEAIVCVKELQIDGGNYSFQTELLRCKECGEFARQEMDHSQIEECPECHSSHLENINRTFQPGRGRQHQGGHGRGRNR